MKESVRRRKGSLQHERNGSWTMRVAVSGKTYSRRASSPGRAAAAAELAGFVAEMEREHAAPPEPGELAKEWLRLESSPGAARFSPQMKAKGRRAWERFSEWMAHRHPDVADAGGVTRDMAEEYMQSYGEKMSAATFNLCACRMKRLFRELLGGPDSQNPFAFVSARFPDSHPRRELSADEVSRIVASAESAGGEWPCLVAIAAYTGLRLGDCCNLEWNSVDLARGFINVVPAKTRRFSNGRSVAIPIHGELMKMFSAKPAVARSGFVLPSIAEMYRARRWRISKGLERIFDDAGIVRSVMYEGRKRLVPSATFHSLRHTFVSFAANAGVPLAVVQAIVGHATTAMTRRYYHASESALRRAVDAIPSFGRPSGGRVRPAPDSGISARGAERPSKRSPSISQRLVRAKKLFQRGFISGTEYAALRGRILLEA